MEKYKKLKSFVTYCLTKANEAINKEILNLQDKFKEFINAQYGINYNASKSENEYTYDCRLYDVRLQLNDFYYEIESITFNEDFGFFITIIVDSYYNYENVRVNNLTMSNKLLIVELLYKITKEFE